MENINVWMFKDKGFIGFFCFFYISFRFYFCIVGNLFWFFWNFKNNGFWGLVLLFIFLGDVFVELRSYFKGEGFGEMFIWFSFVV